MTTPNTGKPFGKLTLLVRLLDHAGKIVPAARYFWGVVAASVTVGIIAVINGLSWLTVVAISAAIIAMFVFYIFSRIEKSTDVVVKLAGYALIVVTTLAFIFVIVTSGWLALACKPRLLAYLYGVSQVCYGPPPKPTAGPPPKPTALIDAQCQPKILTTTPLAPGETLNVLQLWPLPEANGGGGLADMSITKRERIRLAKTF
jgi:hypothetical protein